MTRLQRALEERDAALIMYQEERKQRRIKDAKLIECQDTVRVISGALRDLVDAVIGVPAVRAALELSDPDTLETAARLAPGRRPPERPQESD